MGDAVFLQMWVFGYPPGNGALWSLHYEVVFYTAFVAIWVSGINLSRLIIGLIAISSLLLLTNAHGIVCACYFVIWLQGLWLSRQERTEVSTYPIVATVAVLIAFFSGNAWSVLVAKLAPPVFASYNIPHPLTALASSWTITCLIGSLVGVKIRYAKLYLIFLAAITCASVVYAFYAGLLSKLPNYRVALTGLVAWAGAMMFEQTPTLSWRSSKHLGEISYALCAVHGPIMILFLAFAAQASLTIWSLTCATLTSLVPSFLVAYAIERGMQPRLTLFLRRRTSALP